jgi:hypothetical protein
MTSIPAALLRYSPVLDHTNNILGAGADTRVALGALPVILLIIAIGIVSLLAIVTLRQDVGASTSWSKDSSRPRSSPPRPEMPDLPGLPIVPRPLRRPTADPLHDPAQLGARLRPGSG